VKNNLKSVFTFVMLVFILSIPFWILSAVYPIQILPGLPLSALEAFTPAFAALILIYRNERFAGVLHHLSRSFDFKRVKNPIWFFIVILINPIIAVLAYGVLLAVGKSIPNHLALSVSVLPMFILFFITALGEEIGWSGYATEPLQSKLGTINSGILLGVVGAVWHLIPLLQASRSLEWIAWWSLGTISLRTIMVWIFANAGKSVFALAVFHAMINLCWQLFPINGSFYDPKVFGLISLGIAIIVSVIQATSSHAKTQAA
jgi:membrane protease YdiL (CAAX protease family)